LQRRLPPCSLPSVPTRRSSDLDDEFDQAMSSDGVGRECGHRCPAACGRGDLTVRERGIRQTGEWATTSAGSAPGQAPAPGTRLRSEEHTSELQSREISYAVFCL